MKMLALVLLAMTLAAPSVAMDAAAADGGATTQKPKKAKLICRRIDGTGSHMSNRVCKTQEEWNDADASDQDSLDMKNNGAKTGCTDGMSACTQGRGGPYVPMS